MTTTFSASTAGTNAAIREPGLPWLEVLAGETVTLAPNGSPLDSVAQISGPSSPTISGLSIGPISTTGRYRFAVTSAGRPVDLQLVVFEAGVLMAIPDAPRNAGTRGPLTALEKRLIVRSMSHCCPTFDGSIANMPGSLYPFGG